MAKSAVEIILGAEVEGQFNISTRLVTVTTAIIVALRNNPERVGWLVFNTGATEVQLGWSPDVAAPAALPIAANGGGLTVNIREDFILPIFPLYAVVTAASTTLYVVEIFRTSK